MTFQSPQGPYRALWTALRTEADHPDRLSDKALAQAVAAKVPPGTTGEIQSIETKRMTINPPLLFSLEENRL